MAFLSIALSEPPAWILVLLVGSTLILIVMWAIDTIRWWLKKRRLKK